MPERNNDPTTLPIDFNSALTKEQVMNICGCDPAHYYEFSFFDTRVTQITKPDGSIVTDGDPVIGQSVSLNGFMVDISPSAICAVIHAGKLSVGDWLKGGITPATQSQLRTNIRPMGFTDESAAAHFETEINLDNLETITGSVLSGISSESPLSMIIHLNRYTRLDNPSEGEGARLTGDVYGIIFPSGITTGLHDISKIWNRRLLPHPQLSTRVKIEKIFLGVGPDGKVENLSEREEIEGKYDILEGGSLIALRYLDFVPFIDRNYSTPDVLGYRVYVVTGGVRSLVGEFTGDVSQMRRDAGVVVFNSQMLLLDDLDSYIEVDVLLENEEAHPLMSESEWDLELESSRGLTLASEESQNISARVWYKNRPAVNHAVQLISSTGNGRSPIVASFSEEQVLTGSDGRIFPAVMASNLDDLKGILDPITGIPINSLSYDRYAGNFVYLTIPNEKRKSSNGNEIIELSIRVLRKFSDSDIPDSPSFRRDLEPIFSYYRRYFPWLHVRELPNGYFQFLDIWSYESVKAYLPLILDRFSRNSQDPMYMPRSRDLPFGTVKVLRKWQDAGTPE